MVELNDILAEQKRQTALLAKLILPDRPTCLSCAWWADQTEIGTNYRRCGYLNQGHPEAPAMPDDSEAQLMTRVDFGCTDWKASR